jgi:threonine dehydrogenase-like Zn-dependent dehydrogenase
MTSTATTPKENEKSMQDRRATVIEFTGPRQFVQRDYDFPELGSGDILVEVIICGVDGSEIHMYRGEMDWINARVPIIFGDEIVGRVVEAGATALEERGLAIGDRVVVESRWPCEGCHACDAGQYYLCENKQRGHGYGMLNSAEAPHLWGGYATHVFVPREALVYPVPSELDDETALLACSALANGIRWTGKGGVKEGSHVLIVGPGPQGLSCVIAAIDTGARVTVVGLPSDANRLEQARSFGATPFTLDTSLSPAESAAQIIEATAPIDTVIETAGVQSSKSLAFAAVRRMGTVVNVSVPNPNEQLVNWREMTLKEITVVNPLSHPHTVEEGLQLGVRLKNKGISLRDLVTHVYPLEQAAEALAAASYEIPGVRPVKVVLDPALDHVIDRTVSK